MKKLADLLEQTKQVDDELVRHDKSIEKAKEMFVKRISADRRQRSTSSRPAWVLAATVSGFGAAIITVAILGYFLGQNTRHEVAPMGKWLSAPANSELPIEFPNGSRIVLSPGAEGRITETDGRKVVLFLERGEARFYVHDKGRSDWRVNAGPYEVRVTGTVFSTSWQPDSTHFLLKVFEGEVQVAGPLTNGGHKVAANHSFFAVVNENKIELALLENPEKDIPDESQIHEIDNKNETLPKQNSKTATASRIGQPKDKWIDAARKGRYKAAMKQIEKLDLEALLNSKGPEELFLLGDSARLTRRYAVAEHAYLAVRSRFEGTGHARAAALVLGRMAFDQLGNYKKASSWLEVYLREGKSSHSNREILGRLLEAEHKSGANEKARATAKRYLAKYPEGPHSELAKSLLDG